MPSSVGWKRFRLVQYGQARILSGSILVSVDKLDTLNWNPLLRVLRVRLERDAADYFSEFVMSRAFECR